MIPRAYGPALRALLRQFPAVTILGPRQCGKTTFIRQALPRWRYVDLERPSDVAPLAADPEARLDQLGDHVILDEAQRLPEIFPVLRGVIDRQQLKRGRYVLLGSASPSLIIEISQSWEAFIVDQLATAYDREHRDSRAWFWRTAQGDDVDLLMETPSRLVPFEITLHSAPGAADAKSLRRCMADLHLDRGYLVHSGREQYSLGDGVTAVPTRRLLRRPSAVGTL